MITEETKAMRYGLSLAKNAVEKFSAVAPEAIAFKDGYLMAIDHAERILKEIENCE